MNIKGTIKSTKSTIYKLTQTQYTNENRLKSYKLLTIT